MKRPSAAWRPAAPGNFRSGRSASISQITFHHIVGDADAAIARFQTNGEEVSATYVIGSDGRLYQTVAEEDTPYTDGNFDSNSRSITIEHAGGLPSVPYTDAMYATSAQLCAYLIDKYGIQSFKRHRDVSDAATECPGGLDVERIIKQAKALIEGGDMLLTPDDVEVFIFATLYRHATEQDIKDFTGKTLTYIRDAVDRSDERKDINAKVWAKPETSDKKIERIKQIVEE